LGVGWRAPVRMWVPSPPAPPHNGFQGAKVSCVLQSIGPVGRFKGSHGLRIPQLSAGSQIQLARTSGICPCDSGCSGMSAGPSGPGKGPSLGLAEPPPRFRVVLALRRQIARPRDFYFRPCWGRWQPTACSLLFCPGDMDLLVFPKDNFPLAKCPIGAPSGHEPKRFASDTAPAESTVAWPASLDLRPPAVSEPLFVPGDGIPCFGFLPSSRVPTGLAVVLKGGGYKRFCQPIRTHQEVPVCVCLLRPRISRFPKQQ